MPDRVPVGVIGPGRRDPPGACSAATGRLQGTEGPPGWSKLALCHVERAIWLAQETCLDTLPATINVLGRE
jgi:hypothetical protein